MPIHYWNYPGFAILTSWTAANIFGLATGGEFRQGGRISPTLHRFYPHQFKTTPGGIKS
ncbi:hypothetical protein [Spirosoma pomorum]